jgi:hypothetical protein
MHGYSRGANSRRNTPTYCARILLFLSQPAKQPVEDLHPASMSRLFHDLAHGSGGSIKSPQARLKGGDGIARGEPLHCKAHGQNRKGRHHGTKEQMFGPNEQDLHGGRKLLAMIGTICGAAGVGGSQ